MDKDRAFDGYNACYQIISEGYTASRYIIVKKFDAIGSILYTPNNAVEANSLVNILELICSDNLQIVVTNSPETYMEYAPYTPENDLKALITYVMNH